MTDEKFRALFNERVKSHIQDGYFPVVTSTTGKTLFVKLQHRTNCNVIKVWGFMWTYRLEQWTNDKLTFITYY